jgi:hypothetical protein
MRLPARTLAAWLVTTLVAGCSGATGSLPAAASATAPSPSPSPSPSSAAVATPSPLPLPTPTPAPTVWTVQSPDPSFSQVHLTCEDYLTGCVLHRTNDAGVEPPGWPVELTGTLVDNRWNDFTIGCGPSREPFVRGGIEDVTYVGVVGPDGPEIQAINSDGTRSRRWPQPLPAPDGDCHGFMFSPSQDQIVAWGYDGVVPDIELVADRTEFTVLDLDGSTRPGWPRGSEGAASGPVWFDDGIAYVSETGRVWAHDAGGDVRPGWGYRLASKHAPVSFGDRLAILQPVAERDDEVVAIGLDGQPAPGYPAELGGEIETRCLFGDTPCSGLVGPTMAPDGTVFVALGNDGDHEVTESGQEGGRITAVGPTGERVQGWPVQLPERTHATHIGWSSEGPVIARVVVCAPGGCEDVEREELLWYGLDGEWLEDMPRG